MANTSILNAFERMWQHIVAKLETKSNDGHAHSWNDLTDKPFGEIETTFNGDIEGKEILQVNGNLTFVKINDYILKEEDCVGKTARLHSLPDDTVEDVAISSNGIIDITSLDIPGFMVIPDELLDVEVPVVAVVKKPVSTEDFSLSTGTYYVIVDASNIGGVHFYTEYFSAFDNIEAIKKLDSKYLPDHLPRIEIAMSDSPMVFDGDMTGKEKIMIAANTYLVKVSESYVDTTTMIGSELTAFVAGYENTDVLTQDIVIDGNVAFGTEGAVVVSNNIPYVLSLPKDSTVQYSGTTFEVSKGTWFFYNSNTSDISYIKCLSCLYDTQEVIKKLDVKYLPDHLPAMEKDGEIVTVLPLAEYMDDNGWIDSSYYEQNTAIDNILIYPHKIYTVVFNGVEYECTPKLTEDGLLCLGNFNIPSYNDSEGNCIDTGEPFCYENQLIWTESIGETTATIGITTTKDKPKQLDDKYLNCLTTEGIGNTLTINSITKYPFVTIDKMNYYKVSDEVPDNISGVAATSTTSEPSEKTLNFYNDDNGDTYASEIDMANDAKVTCLSIIFDSNTTIGGIKLLGSGIYIGLTKELADKTLVTGYYHTIVFPNHEFKKYVVKDEYLPTPNWNASEGEEGYIENRTHYMKKSPTTIIPLGEYYDDGGGLVMFYDDGTHPENDILQSIQPPVIGATYVVLYNGVEYVLTCARKTDDGGAVITGFGNPQAVVEVSGCGAIDWEEDTDAPFFVSWWDDDTFDAVYVLDSEEGLTKEISVSRIDEVAHKLDNKYLSCMTTERIVGKTYIVGDVNQYPSVVVGQGNGKDIIAYRISEDVITDVTDATFLNDSFTSLDFSTLACEERDTYKAYYRNDASKTNYMLWLVYGNEINGVKVAGAGIYVGRWIGNTTLNIASITFPNNVVKKPVIREDYLPTLTATDDGAGNVTISFGG